MMSIKCTVVTAISVIPIQMYDVMAWFTALPLPSLIGNCSKEVRAANIKAE